jgi:hypothetical protein
MKRSSSPPEDCNRFDELAGRTRFGMPELDQPGVDPAHDAVDPVEMAF